MTRQSFGGAERVLSMLPCWYFLRATSRRIWEIWTMRSSNNQFHHTALWPYMPKKGANVTSWWVFCSRGKKNSSLFIMPVESEHHRPKSPLCLPEPKRKFIVSQFAALHQCQNHGFRWQASKPALVESLMDEPVLEVALIDSTHFDFFKNWRINHATLSISCLIVIVLIFFIIAWVPFLSNKRSRLSFAMFGTMHERKNSFGSTL